MYTVCPKCALTLAVTAADLRAGQGYVRCGRCANVFNALLALSDCIRKMLLHIDQTGLEGEIDGSAIVDRLVAIRDAQDFKPPSRQDD